MKQLSILLIIGDPDIKAGGGRNAATMASVMERLGHKVTILSYSRPFWKFVWKARALARANDIVQVVDMNPLGYAGYLATRFTRAKLVIIAQAAYAVAPLHNPKAALIAKYVYRAADAVVAGSTYVADEIEKKVPGLKVRVIDPGIDMQKFPSTGSVAKANPPFIMSVGAVKARKGHDISIRAFALLHKKLPDVRYVIVGSQKDKPLYFKAMQDLVCELGVEDAVEFRTGVPNDELNQLYETATLFILTSVNIGFHFEGFGMVFLEAAAHGLPGIGTLGNGIADAIEEGKTGFLVPQKDPLAAAEAMEKILTNEPLRAQMSARARAFAEEHDLPHLEKLYRELYASLFV